MTVPSVEPVKNHYGDGSCTNFDFDFYIENEQQLAVYKINSDNIETKLVCGIDYSIHETGNQYGSYIVFPIQGSSYSVLQPGDILSLQLDLTIEQETEYDVSDKINLHAVEYSFDYVTRILQMLSRRLDRAVKVVEGSSLTADELVNIILTSSERTQNDVQAAKNAAQNAYETLLKANELFKNTQELYKLVGDKVTPEFLVTHNLFAIEELDKKLSETELIGYGEQNTEQSYDIYPDAYLELADDFMNGQTQIFASDDVDTYCKSFTGSITGNFYIAASDNIQAGIEIFSDKNLTQSLGEITSYDDVAVNSYIGNVNNFYIPLGSDLSNGIQAYSDKALSTLIGTVTDMKNDVTGRKYTASSTGVFYTQNNELAKGCSIFVDEALTINRGSVTDVTKFYADKYSVTGLGEVYVPQNAIISVDTVLYSDNACTVQAARVTRKGGGTPQSSVYQYLASNVVVIGYNNGIGTAQPFYFYTKEPLSATAQACYSDVSCSAVGRTSNGLVITGAWIGSGALNFSVQGGSQVRVVIALSYTLVYSTAAVLNNYICINNSTEELSYSKIGTDSADVISVNTERLETFTLDEIYNKSFIKFDNGDYQSYRSDGTDVGGVITVNDGEAENIINNGLTSLSGLTFEYKLAPDFHKVVDAKYKNAVASYIQAFGNSPFYVIDTENKTFTLPLKDGNKFIYFCLGNTKIKSASIDLMNMMYQKIENIDNSLIGILGV